MNPYFIFSKLMLGSLCYAALFPPKTWSQFSLGASFLHQSKKAPNWVLFALVDPKGFEPSTSALRTQRSPNWAMNPYMILIKFRLAFICHRQRQPSSSNWAMNPYIIACRHYGKRYYTTTEGKMQPAFWCLWDSLKINKSPDKGAADI